MISELLLGQILIRNLDDAALARLRLRASEQKVPLERLVRDALHDLARPSREELWNEAERLRNAVGKVTGDSTDMVREDRDSR
jgi:plasmid stability protein